MLTNWGWVCRILPAMRRRLGRHWMHRHYPLSCADRTAASCSSRQTRHLLDRAQVPEEVEIIWFQKSPRSCSDILTIGFLFQFKKFGVSKKCSKTKWDWFPDGQGPMGTWLTGSEQPRRLHDQKYQIFSLINSFSEMWYQILGKTPPCWLSLFWREGHQTN